MRRNPQCVCLSGRVAIYGDRGPQFSTGYIREGSQGFRYIAIVRLKGSEISLGGVDSTVMPNAVNALFTRFETCHTGNIYTCTALNIFSGR